MVVKIEHTVAGHNHILQQCIFDVHASLSMGSQTAKIAQIYAFVHRNLLAYMEN